MDYPSETGLCKVVAFPRDTPSSIFLRRGVSLHRLSETISHEWSVSSMKTAISVINECRGPALSWALACLLLIFHKDSFKLTIDISVRKIILEIEHFIKSMIYQMLKFFKRIASFYPEMILRPFFCFEDTKKTGLLIFNSLKQKKLIFNLFVNCN